jgi:adenylate cyclase
MTRESFSARLMRSYARWRLAMFAALAVLAAGLFLVGEGLVGKRVEWHESWETGGWLQNLFTLRGDFGGDTGVEIIGFDKSMKAEDYAGLVESNPTLGLIAKARGVNYDRAVFAAVLDRLVAAGAKQVVFDFVFEAPGISESGDKAFAEAIRRHRDKVVIGFDYKITERMKDSGNAERIVSRSEPFEELIPDESPESVLGFVSVWPDSAGRISRMVSREDRVTLSKPEMSSTYADFEDMSLTARAVAKAGGSVDKDNSGRIINFMGKARTFTMTPVQDIFTPDRWKGDLRDGARFKDKYVIVGPYSELHYKDAFPTPVGMMLGVEIQANCLRNHALRGWITQPLEGWGARGAAAAALLAVVFIVNALVRTRRMGLKMAVVFSIPIVYLVCAYVMFSRGDAFLPSTPAIYALTLALVFVVLDFVHALYEKSRIKGMFGTYLSPTIVNRMVASGEEPKLGGEQVSLTAFFSDVQSFSSFSEILTPEQLVAIMNEYLGAMTEILEEDAGTLDKYIGDAIVAMFGAPLHLDDHAHRGCACALRMQKRLAELRAEWASQGDKWPKKIHAMRMRIGLNTGHATVGNMGSAKRFNYTMMGDTVNLAARCESGAKSAGVYTLVSGETAEAAHNSPGDVILFRKIDLWRVKGRSTAVTMFEVVDFMDAASAETKECVRLYEAALELYFQKKFAEAKALFEQARALEPLQPGRDPGVEHTASEIMSERCDDMLAAPPPADWDGVYVMTSK